MTVLECIDGARDILKDTLSNSRTLPDDSSSFFTDTFLLKCYNWTQLDIQKKLIETFENWMVTSTQITLTAGTEEVAMPTDCVKIVRIEDAANSSAPVEVRPISFNDKDRFNHWTNVTQAGEAETYCIYGNRLIFRPVPSERNSSVRVYYNRKIDNATFTSASEVESIIPGQYHEALVWGIVKRAMIKGEATAEALTIANAEYNNLIADLMKTAENRQVQRPRFIKRRR